MIVYTENYGADADGNRGRLQWEYELEKSDEEEIKRQILEQIPEVMTITMICPYTDEDIEFEVEVKDYL